MPFISEKYQISHLLTDLKVQLDFDGVFSVLLVEQTLFGKVEKKIKGKLDLIPSPSCKNSRYR